MSTPTPDLDVKQIATNAKEDIERNERNNPVMGGSAPDGPFYSSWIRSEHLLELANRLIAAEEQVAVLSNAATAEPESEPERPKTYFERYVEQQMEDPEFRAAFEAVEADLEDDFDEDDPYDERDAEDAKALGGAFKRVALLAADMYADGCDLIDKRSEIVNDEEDEDDGEVILAQGIGQLVDANRIFMSLLGLTHPGAS